MPWEGGEIVPIRWNAKRVKESTDMLEEALRKAVDPLEEARLIAREALNIPELPLYIGQNFMNLIGKIDDSVGGGRFSPEGWIDRYIKRIRENIPTEAVKAVETREKYGSTLSLV
jgi:hypothetical protein